MAEGESSLGDGILNLVSIRCDLYGDFTRAEFVKKTLILLQDRSQIVLADPLGQALASEHEADVANVGAGKQTQKQPYKFSVIFGSTRQFPPSNPHAPGSGLQCHALHVVHEPAPGVRSGTQIPETPSEVSKYNSQQWHDDTACYGGAATNSEENVVERGGISIESKEGDYGLKAPNKSAPAY